MTREEDAARDEAEDEADSPAIGDFLRRVARADPCEPGGAAIPDPLLGAVLDAKYRIDALLGRGGMGTVYAATHVGTRRAVALKVLIPELTADEAAVDRFAREARAAGQIRHPNVVDVTDFGFAARADGGSRLAYLVMERLEGRTLRALLDEEGRVPLDAAMDVLGQIGAAVGEAHRLGILHRDLKPENIYLESGAHGRHRVKVLDFGIAKLVQEASVVPAGGRLEASGASAAGVVAPSPLAATGAFDVAVARTLRAGSSGASATGASGVVGTPRYMSPEQWLGSASDARTDIYSLGVLAYEMLAGEAPFDGRERSIWIEHAESAPPSLAQRAPAIPLRVVRVIEAALAKDPAGRPPSVAAFVAGLSVGAETTGRLLRRSLALCADHFALLSRRCAPLTVPPVILALLAVVASSFAGTGVLSRNSVRITVDVLRGLTLASLLLWTPVSGGLVPLVASLVAGGSSIPGPPSRSELWRDLRRGLPSTLAFLALLLVATVAVLAVGDGIAWAAGFRGRPVGPAILLAMTSIACLVGSATTASFSVIGPAVVVEGARGLAPLRRSAHLVRPVFRAAFGVTLVYQVLNQGFPEVGILVLRAVAPSLSGESYVDAEALRELVLWIAAAAVTPFAMVPSALLYLRAREAEGNPLGSR